MNKAQTFTLVRKSDPLPDKDLFLVIFGEPGVGKTTISFTGEKPILHFDFDKGLDRALQNIRPDAYTLDTYGDFRSFIFSEDFKDLIETEGYKTVNLDTIGTLLDNYISPWLISTQPKLGNRSGALTQSGWGSLSMEFSKLLNRLQSFGLTVTAVCHAKEVGDENNKQMKLAVKGGSAGIIYQSCDMLGYMYMSGSARVLDFNPRETHPGKNVAALDILQIPSGDSPRYDDFIFDRVITPCLDRMKDKSVAQIELNKDLEIWLTQLDVCKSESDFNTFIHSVKSIPASNKILIDKIRVLVAVALKDKGFKFNPVTMQVELLKTVTK